MVLSQHERSTYYRVKAMRSPHFRRRFGWLSDCRNSSKNWYSGEKDHLIRLSSINCSFRRRPALWVSSHRRIRRHPDPSRQNALLAVVVLERIHLTRAHVFDSWTLRHIRLVSTAGAVRIESELHIIVVVGAMSRAIVRGAERAVLRACHDHGGLAVDAYEEWS